MAASVRKTKGKALESGQIMDKYAFFNNGRNSDMKIPEPKSPFRNIHHQPVTSKVEGPHIDEAYNKFANSPADIFDSMQYEFLGPIREGKRMFKELTNKSKSTNMYPVSDKRNEIKELFNRRHTSDFANKHGVPYVPPPVVKDFEKKHSFVHNCLANKPKNNVEFLEKIFHNKVLNT